MEIGNIIGWTLLGLGICWDWFTAHYDSIMLTIIMLCQNGGRS